MESNIPIYLVQIEIRFPQVVHVPRKNQLRESQCLNHETHREKNKTSVIKEQIKTVNRSTSTKKDWHAEKMVNCTNSVLLWSLPKPNCCSRRIPMNSKLSMLITKWIRPAWSQIQLIRRHPWCWWTTLAQSRAPIFSKLQDGCEIFVRTWVPLSLTFSRWTKLYPAIPNHSIPST